MERKRPLGYIKGKGDPLEKTIHNSSKYNYVQKTMDTGLTIRDVHVLSNKQVVQRKNEKFNRIKYGLLKQIINRFMNQEQYKLDQKTGYYDSKMMDSKYHFKNDSKQSILSKSSVRLNVDVVEQYVLVDLREPCERNSGYIEDSVSVPAVEIIRDKIPKMIYDLKNQKGSLIIVYSDNDRNGISAANHLYEKGYDNVYLLTGGIQLFQQECKELVVGQIKRQNRSGKERVRIIQRSNYIEPTNEIFGEKRNQQMLSRYMDSKSSFGYCFHKQ